MPLDARAREIVQQAAYALRMMQRGAARPRCDWAIDLERGLELPFLRSTGARGLAARACLRARLRFEEGKTAEGIDDVAAVLTLARHFSRDGTLDSLRAAYQIEQRLGEVLARYLPKLDAKTIRSLTKRLDALPPQGSLVAATLRMEESLLNWIAGEVQEATDKDSLLAFLSQLCGTTGEAPEKRRAKALAFLAECGGSARGVLQSTEQARAPLALLAKKLDLPAEQFENELLHQARKLGNNPLLKLFAPVLLAARVHQAQATVRRALLSAALAVELDGKAALKKHPDPVAGGMLDYEAFEGGFVLRSKWKIDEKVRSKWGLSEQLVQPLALTVGSRGK
jgi:hypothetical protein